MSDSPQTQPPGWYYAQGDPPGTQRYWDGSKWEGGPQPVPGLGGDSPVGVGGASGSDLGEPLFRILARLIDLLVWIVWWVIITSIVIGGSVGLSASGADDVSYVPLLLAGLLIPVGIVAYEVLLVANRGQTLGKMALNLKVVKPDRSSADMPVAFRRMMPYIVLAVLSAIIPFFGIISFFGYLIIGLVSLVFLFTDAQRQTVWDKVGGTIVVSTK